MTGFGMALGILLVGIAIGYVIVKVTGSGDARQVENGSGNVEEVSGDQRGEQDRPCNEVGHDWPEWEDSPFSVYADSTSAGRRRRQTVKISQGQSRNCRKCDKYDSRKRVIGHVEVDIEDNTLKVVDI